jgi:hypothetical protein
MPEARECGEACLALTTRTGQYWGSALARMILADLAWADGDLAAAREYGLAALQFTRLAMPPRETARCLARLGRVAMAQGEPGPARGYLAESLQLSLATGSRAWFTEGLLACADLAAAEGSPGRAVQLAAAVTTLCETAGLPLPPPVLTGEYRAAAAASGEPPDELWAAGLSLTSRDAVCLAEEPPAKAPVGSQPARP